MSRRRREDLTFSLDSFLDVVCNLVGILLILIIVAGMRVSREPIVITDSEPAPDAPAGTEDEAASLAARIHLAEIGRWLEQTPEAPVDPIPAEAPPTDLITQAEQLRRRIELLTLSAADLQSNEAIARQNRERSGEELRQTLARLHAAESQVRQGEADAGVAARSVRELEGRVAQLDAAAAALAEQTPRTQLLKHSVTPLSRQVAEQDEMHFRLSGNRVSVVPLDSLAEAVKFRLERSRDLFLRVNRYEGTAGPVDGFLMRYVVERQQPSAIEELRNGGPFMRIQLTYYELEIGPNVVSESAEEALSPGSRFLNAVAKARTGTALTFWVYPDSFELHRALQDYAHEAGIDVAARPLPEGVPIAGSPHGSRSAAQ